MGAFVGLTGCPSNPHLSKAGSRPFDLLTTVVLGVVFHTSTFQKAIPLWFQVLWLEVRIPFCFNGIEPSKGSAFLPLGERTAGAIT